VYISLKDLKEKTNDEKNYLIIGPGTSGKSTLIKELNGSKYGGNFKKGKKSNTFKDYNILFLAPNYGPKKAKIDINNWIKVLKKEKAIAIVCYVLKNIQVTRLTKRLKERWFKDIINNEEIDKVIKICMDNKLDIINDKYIKKDKYIKNILKAYFYKDYFFSYNELYKVLNENKIKFYIINTFEE